MWVLHWYNIVISFFFLHVPVSLYVLTLNPLTLNTEVNAILTCHVLSYQYNRMSFSSNLNHYGMVHAASVSDVLLDTSFTPPCQRMGAMVAFRSFQEFTRWVPPIESLYLIKNASRGAGD